MVIISAWKSILDNNQKMWRSNFIFKLFKNKKSNKIIQYNSNKRFALQEQINIQITEIDQKISENNKALVEAQIIKFRSTFSRPNNFIEQIGKNVYKSKLEDSIKWHQKELKELYLRRGELEMNLEKIKGVFWINRLKRFLKIILIGFILLFSLFIFLSGFMIVIYLLPLIILIFLGYSLVKKKD